MTTNGGTLHGVPQPPGGHHNCSQCGLVFDSSASLQVHMHYHHETMNRWGPPTGGSSIPPPPPSSLSNSSTSPTDSENNNQPPGKQHHLQRSKSSSSPPQNNTIAAAADSSDNQPPTPTPQSAGGDPGTPQSYSGTSSPYQQGIPQPPPQDLHYTYMHNYDQYYHSHNAMDYVTPPPPPHHLNNHHQQQEYKIVPSSRYHPYMHNSSHQNSPSATQSSLSPSVVSSSSPTTTTTTPQSQSQIIPPGQPTPSPSPKQCDKCGLVCESAGQLSEHLATAHPAAYQAQQQQLHNQHHQQQQQQQQQNDVQSNNLNRSNDEHNDLPLQILHFGNTVIKEEQPSDILDLDSQKMVYPPHHDHTNEGGALPPMNSIHNMHSLQRPPMSWGHESHPFMPPHHQQELKLGYYSQPMPSIKQEFPLTIKSEYIHPTLPLPPNESKPFGSDVSSGNQVATSPNDFPTTTTPQENGPQFRSFEPPTSSLPNSGGQMKSTTWKSNEARRPKTYNCTACNKWFTSSGHLKRHYNTTLHKNAVKSSGQPDPATLPISAHHHPSRDPNHKHNRRNNSAQQPAPPAPPPEPPRSPEYTPQYTPPSGFGTPQPQPTGQGFQQYGTTLHSTTPGGPPNGQAGPSVLASQPRGLLIYLNNNMATQQQEVPHQDQIHTTTSIITHPQHHQLMHQHHQSQQQLSLTNIINSTDQYNITSPIAINTNTTTTPLYQVIQLPEGHQQNYHHIIGNTQDEIMGCDSSSALTAVHHHDVNNMHYHNNNNDDDEMNVEDNKEHIKLSIQSMMINRLSGGAAMYQGDTAPPFSPDIPEQYTSSSSNLYAHDGRSNTPRMGETAPHSPCSPSVTSSGTTTASFQNLNNINNNLNIINDNYLNDNTILNKTTLVHQQQQQQQQQQQNQQQHQQINQSDAVTKEPHRCLQCDKVFNKACYLTQHNKTFHSGDKPFRCQRCGKRFPCDQSHEEHFAKHAGEKPFKCELCPKQFNHKTDLRRHMCVHSGAKPYACELCGKGFIRKDHMIKHTETHRRKTIQAINRDSKLKNKMTISKKLMDATDNNDIGNNITSITN